MFFSHIATIFFLPSNLQLLLQLSSLSCMVAVGGCIDIYQGLQDL